MYINQEVFMNKHNSHSSHSHEHERSHALQESGEKTGLRTESKILIAFILNLAFSVFELAGGLFCGSVAIASDAVHDFGDAISIGISYFLERKSRKKPNSTYTYGYGRFSVLGAFITNTVLLAGSVTVIFASIKRLLSPEPINYNVMIIFAVAGLLINLIATLITSKGENLNERSINLHMLEDVLGWAVVLIGSIVMRFTDFYMIDAIMSIGVSVYMLYHVAENMIEIGNLFLIRIPRNISVEAVRENLLKISGVEDAHHIHIWGISSETVYATMHVVTDGKDENIKALIREALREMGIVHVTLELELAGEECSERECLPAAVREGHGHHHHHH